MSEGLNRKLSGRDIVRVVVMVIFALVPYALRQIYPDSVIIQGLFGGIRLLIYWMILCYIALRMDKGSAGK